MATILKMLKRHWLPLGTFVLIFSLLSWLLQPRPREAHTFAMDDEHSLWGHGDSRTRILSPSGRYLCFTSQESNEPYRDYLHLFDVFTQTWLFKVRCDADKISAQPTFTANDELIYSAYYDPDTIKLSFWKPGDAKPRAVHEYKFPIVYPDEEPADGLKKDSPLLSPGDAPFDGLIGFNGAMLQDRTLSPDGLTWLVLRKQNRLMYLDFIDSRTGERKAIVDVPPVDLQKRAVREINVAFDLQSHFLFLRVRNKEDQEKDEEKIGKEPTTVYWIEVPSGKTVQSKVIRNELVPNGRLLWMDHKQVSFLGWNKGQNVIHILNVNEGYQQLALRDAAPDLVEKVWPSGPLDSKGITVRVYTSIHETKDPNSSLVSYVATHFLTPKHGNGFTMSPRNPGCSISCRDARTGQLNFTRSLDLGRNVEDPGKLTGYGDVTPIFLPGPLCVIRHHNQDYPEWRNKPEDWRYKLSEWIPALKYQFSSTFRIYDPYTGQQKSEIVVPQQNIVTQLSTDQRSFTAFGQVVDFQYQCLIFDYPFHKPWLLIFYWSAGVALVILILQAAKRFLARLTQRVPKP
ncbi:MAG TPA: hypothetical protein PLN21_13345 [Gemmatales bacterium]|nr:hypothetical protein [Gemmatales bacterium]